MSTRAMSQEERYNDILQSKALKKRRKAEVQKSLWRKYKNNEISREEYFDKVPVTRSPESKAWRKLSKQGKHPTIDLNKLSHSEYNKIKPYKFNREQYVPPPDYGQNYLQPDYGAVDSPLYQTLTYAYRLNNYPALFQKSFPKSKIGVGEYKLYTVPLTLILNCNSPLNTTVIFDIFEYKRLDSFLSSVIPNHLYVRDTLVCSDIEVTSSGGFGYYWWSPFIDYEMRNLPSQEREYYSRNDEEHPKVSEQSSNPDWHFISTSSPISATFNITCPTSEYQGSDVLYVPCWASFTDGSSPFQGTYNVSSGSENTLGYCVATINPPRYSFSLFNYTRSYPFLSAEQVIYYRFTNVQLIELKCFITIRKPPREGKIADMDPYRGSYEY